jgi:hypothetical protein
MKEIGHVESGPCAKLCAIVGDRHRTAIRGRSTTVMVLVKNACGDPVTAGDHLTVELNDSDVNGLDVTIE